MKHLEVEERKEEVEVKAAIIKDFKVIAKLVHLVELKQECLIL